MSGRFEERKKLGISPPPGQYGIPKLDGITTDPPRALWGKSSEDRSKTSFIKSTVVSPGPGVYEPLKELGGNITTKTSPAFTMSSRRRPVRPDNGGVPGPDK